MNTRNLITIKEASELLGVTPLTLRNWDKNGKLKALRHPLNNYRVYKKIDIDNLLQSMENGASVVFVSQKKRARKLDVKHEE